MSAPNQYPAPACFRRRSPQPGGWSKFFSASNESFRGDQMQSCSSSPGGLLTSTTVSVFPPKSRFPICDRPGPDTDPALGTRDFRPGPRLGVVGDCFVQAGLEGVVAHQTNRRPPPSWANLASIPSAAPAAWHTGARAPRNPRPVADTG
jgi:hypothetical protein